MTNSSERRLTEEQARRLWEHAARLQAEASTHSLPTEPREDEDEVGVEERMDLDAVRRAATEAGIDASFFDAAVLQLDDAAPGRVDLWADEYLPDDGPSALASRAVPGAPDAVYASLQRVLPNRPFLLDLLKVQGADALEGGTLIFEIPAPGMADGVIKVSKPLMDLRGWADFREIRLRILPVAGDSSRTLIELTAPRATARRINYWFGQSVAGVVGLGSGIFFMGATFGLVTATGPVEGAVGLMVGSLVGLGMRAGVSRWWRRVYRYGQRKGEQALERILDAVELDRRTGGAFKPAITSTAKSEMTTLGVIDQLLDGD